MNQLTGLQSVAKKASRTKQFYPELQTGDYAIRLASQTDAPEIVDYCKRNRKFHGPWEPLRPDGYYTVPFWKVQIDRNIDDFNSGRAVRFYVFNEKEEIIAYISYTNFVRGAGNYCNLGYNLDHKHGGRGVMTECVSHTLDYIHHDLGLHRVMANYMPRNERSGRLLQRLGFVVEGYARQYLMINGDWEDHVLTGKILSD